MFVFSGLLLFVAACSILTGIGFFLSIGEPDSTMTPSTAFCMVALGLPFAIGGGVLLRTTRANEQRRRREAIEEKVLRVAISRNYRITAPEVAMLTDLSLEDARAYLEGLARSGTVAVEVATNGVLVYCFSDARQ
jgi:hypothetical protein